MNKLFAVLILAVVVAPAASSETVFERSFKEMGYTDFEVEGARQRGCTSVSFLFPPDANTASKGVYPIASLGIEFLPVQRGEADVNAYLNGEKVAGLGVADFKCKNRVCWERLEISGETLEEENTLQVCMENSDSIVKTRLLNSSMVGAYRKADFSGKRAFHVSAAKEGVIIGENVKITVSIHNEGSAASFAEVRHARELAEDKNAFFVVEGQAYFKGFVNAGEMEEFSYVIKPRVLGSITPPPAILYWTNEFGEEEAKFSNLVTIKIREPERKVRAFIVKEREWGDVGKAIEMKLAVKSLGKDPLYSLEAELNLPQQLRLIEPPQKKIQLLEPGETRLLPFKVSSLETGEFPITCTVTYTDLNISESKCSDSRVVFRQPEVSPVIYVGTGLTVFAVLVYLYLRFGK